MEATYSVIDEETGVGIRDDEHGHIEVVGLQIALSDKMSHALEMVLSIWKYGLKLDLSKDDSD